MVRTPRRIPRLIGSICVRFSARPWWSKTIVILAVAWFIHFTATRLRVAKNLENSKQLVSVRCNISSPEALSAIERAQTLFCKNEIADFGCALQQDEVYPKILPSFCPETNPNKSLSVGTSLRILFVLTVHGRDIRQVRRLLSLIYRPEYYFVVHVDARHDYLHSKLATIEKELPNFKLLHRRWSPIWGGASLLTALLDAMDFAMEQTEWNWDYFINLSESDLPIK